MAGRCVIILDVTELSFAYPDGTQGLRQVSFHLEPGEKAALIGANGAGKTTLLLTLVGLLSGKGKITVDGLPLNETNLPQIRQRMGVVFQNPDDQLFLPTVYQNVAFGLENMGLSASISEFWRRWHISLGAWFRDYVYIPLGGNRCSKHRQLINLAVVWLLTGLWHGSAWNFVLWGVYHGIFVILEKFVLKDIWPRVPKFLRIFVTTLLVFIGWVLFFSPSLSGAIHYYGQMFGAGHMGLFDGTFRYSFFGSLRLLIVAFLGCGPIVRRIHQRLCYYKGGKLTYVSVIGFVLLLILCVAYMMSATYSSFLYVQF